MSKKVFVSYCHQQGEWVWDRLVPCLRYGGADVLVDRERFKAGFGVIEQMNDAQDAAEMSVLVLTPDYLRSDYCLHEMKRAIASRRPDKGFVIPVKREDCPLPDEIESAEPLWVNLGDDKNSGQWNLLLDACGADLGAEAPHWLETRDEIVRYLQRRQSVNLVVKENPKWREMINHIQSDLLPELGVVDLDKGSTVSRRGLVTELLKACGITRPVPTEPEDLIELDGALSARQMSYVAMLRLDHATHRNYGVDFFSALRFLIMESRKLALLVESRQHFSQLLPQDHPLSAIDLKTVELTGRRR
jgi:hypothetical protein